MVVFPDALPESPPLTRGGDRHDGKLKKKRRELVLKGKRRQMARAAVKNLATKPGAVAETIGTPQEHYVWSLAHETEWISFVTLQKRRRNQVGKRNINIARNTGPKHSDEWRKTQLSVRVVVA